MTMDIEKDIAIVTSGGRTGTSFFGTRLDQIISDCWSTHEPDVWRGVFRRRSWKALQWFGVYHVTLGKILRRTGMRCLTERFISSDWNSVKTAREMERQRRDFYRSRPASLVVESNWQLFGLLPLLPRVLPSYRVLAIVRDPRSWVRSFINFGGHHDERDRVRAIGLPRMSPPMVGDEEWSARWERMDVFQRLCWDWRFIASRLLQASKQDERIRLFRFEDLFQRDGRRSNLEEALDFLTDFGERKYSYSIPGDVYETKVNRSDPDRIGPWSEWPDDQQIFLLDMCGPLMEALGYRIDVRRDWHPAAPE